MYQQTATQRDQNSNRVAGLCLATSRAQSVDVVTFQFYWSPSIRAAHDLNVVIDSQLSLSAHVITLRRSGFYHFRQFCQAARSLSAEAAKTLVHTFISSRLDYCNSLLFGVSVGLLGKVQSVQNAAARHVTGVEKVTTSRLC